VKKNIRSRRSRHRNNNRASVAPLKGVKLGNTVVKENVNDIRKIRARLQKLKAVEKTKRLRALTSAKSDLIKDAKRFKSELISETDKLLSAKSSSLSLINVLNRYTKRLSADKSAQLKLTDKVSVKNELKDKLIKEIEGFRTRPAAYQDLLRVDKGQIDGIVREIKKRLNYQ